jgi:phage tail sheath gpL-like
MSILFAGIPSNLLVPGNYTETNPSRAGSETPAIPRCLVVVGHRNASTAQVAAGTPFRVFNESDAEAGAGAGSFLAESLKAAKKANPYVEMYGIGLAPGGSAVAATGTIAFAGTATARGTLTVYIAPYWMGGELRGKYTVSVASGTAAAAVATALAAAINADPYRTVNAVVDTADVDLTAIVAGVSGNDISVSVNRSAGEKLPTGITATISAMASGAVNPTVSTAIAALGDKHYTHLAQPWTDATSLTALETEATRRWGGTVQQEMKLFTGATGSLSTLTTLGDGRNSEFSAIAGVGLSPCPPWIAAAELAAIDALQNHPMQPRRGLIMNTMLAPVLGSEHDGDDRQALLADGVTTFTFGSDGKCRIDRLVSTYQEDANGNASSTFRDLGVVGTLFCIRYDWRTHVSTKYPRSLHAADGSIVRAGLPVITPGTMKNEFAMRAQKTWSTEGEGWIEDPEQFLADIVIERTEDGMDMIGVPNLINPLHITKTRFDFLR